MTLFQGLIVRIPANNAYRSSPAPNFALFSFIASASANINACNNHYNLEKTAKYMPRKKKKTAK